MKTLVTQQILCLNVARCKTVHIIWKELNETVLYRLWHGHRVKPWLLGKKMIGNYKKYNQAQKMHADINKSCAAHDAMRSGVGSRKLHAVQNIVLVMSSQLFFPTRLSLKCVNFIFLENFCIRQTIYFPCRMFFSSRPIYSRKKANN